MGEACDDGGEDHLRGVNVNMGVYAQVPELKAGHDQRAVFGMSNSIGAKLALIAGGVEIHRKDAGGDVGEIDERIE